jgi:predicted nucleic acid-binding protein
MNVLLDTNVVLDLLLVREPWRIEAEAVAGAAADGRIVAHVGASSITDIFYISRKLVGADQARLIVRACLDTLQIVADTRDILDAADRRAGSDFEDNLQVECAIAAGLDAIITRDPTGFLSSPIAAITPAQLLTRLGPPSANAAAQA